MNAIYLRHRMKVFPLEARGQSPLSAIATVQRNIGSLGFALAPDVIDHLASVELWRLDGFYKRLVKDLRELVGWHHTFDPMYPNFPAEVMALSEAELYLNAFEHYLTLERSNDTGDARPQLVGEYSLRVIRLGDREDFESILTTLARSATPFSPQDRKDVEWFFAQYRNDTVRMLPDVVPSKENLAVLCASIIRLGNESQSYVDARVKSTTDVLRIAVAMSGGDVSLASPSKFGRYSRSERVRLLALMELVPNRDEDLFRWRQRWIRLGERLHPGEYSLRFPDTATSFAMLRSGERPATVNREVERALREGRINDAAATLVKRPGELARRLDQLLRACEDPNDVIHEFAAVSDRVSTPVLLQVLIHFRGRTHPEPLRVFFPKGSVANLFATNFPLPVLRAAVCDSVVSICERSLIGRFVKLPSLGRCYLDPRLSKYLVPFSQRSASKSLRTLARGSRLALPGGSTLRFFVWWRNGSSRVDIDLSAAMYDREYKYIKTIAYYNLKHDNACHSGDIVDAPNGAAEFIDADIQGCRAEGVRYVVMSLSSYTSQPYCDLPECFAGWMQRSMPGSGEIFEPRTVVDKVDIASNSRICLPAIFDLESNEVIWVDIALSNNPRFPNNVQNNLTGVSMMTRAMTSLRKPDLFTLFDLHIRARGERASTRSDADTIFSVEEGITPFDLARINAEFLQS